MFYLSSESDIDLDLDACGGRMFLRVLIHLCMHEYAPLVTGALQLLLRHFGQRQEVLQAFKQVIESSNTLSCRLDLVII